MKKIRNLSAKTIYGFLSIALGMCFANLAASIGLLIYSLIYKMQLPSITELPVLMRINNHTFLQDINQTAIVSRIQGSLLLVSSSTGIKLFTSIYQIVLIISTGLCLWIMRKIIWTVIQGEPFVPQNGKRIKVLAMIVIFVPLILQVSAYFVTKNVITQLNFIDTTLDAELMGRSTGPFYQ